MSGIEKGESHTVNATNPEKLFGPHTNGTNDAAYQYAPRPTNIANAGPLGLFAFASTTFILSIFNLQTRGITHPNVVVGMALFSGGLTQFIAGMWEFPRGNVFGATAFSAYGAFWMSYATILIPSSGILAAYSDSAELASALGIFLITWAMITFFFLIVVLRKTVAFIALLSALDLAFILLAAGQFTGMVGVTKAGGAMGCITAFIAFYMGLAEMLQSETNAVILLPLGAFSVRR